MSLQAVVKSASRFASKRVTPQPSEPTQHPAQHQLRPGAFGGAGRGHAADGRLGQHGFEVSILGIGKTGVIYGVFHAPTEAALKMSR